MKKIEKILKRIMDIVLSISILIIFSPIFLIIIIILFLNNGGKVFFPQQRPGKDSKPFTIIKFKTMNDLRGPDGRLLPDKDRITAAGRVIRTFSLDELPQLINVIKGDMSIVGPRPLLAKYLTLYTKEQKRRHEMRPGITGWAQVNGRNDISWKKKFELDLWYIDNFSLWLDIRILFKSIMKIAKREGISKQGEATTEAFNGHN